MALNVLDGGRVLGGDGGDVAATADCLSVTSRVYAGMFAVEVRFLIRDQFWIPRPKLHGTKYLIFVKPQNGLV